MAIVTTNPHTWVRIVNEKTGQELTIMNSETYGNNYTIGFEANFANSATPQSCQITFYNLSEEHRKFLKKGLKVYLYFNWGSSKKLLVEGYITKIDTKTTDGVTDTQTFTFKEGTDYSNISARKIQEEKKKTVSKYKKTTITKNGKKTTKKVKTKTTKTQRVNRVFRAGTSYKAVIQGIASAAGIKIAKLELAKNPKLKKAYTAKGKPLNLLKQLVKQTNSAITYVRGKLEIVNPKSLKRTWVEIDDQDLIQPPSYNESDDDKSSDGTWEIVIPLLPEITTNVGVEVNSKYLKGRFYVTAGQHTNDGENPQTQCSLKKM